MIRINNLIYRYPEGKRAVDSVSLSVSRGEFVIVIGNNGSGKTTLLRHINALLLPDSGSVTVRGMDTANRNNIPAIRQAAGMVFQDPQSQFIGMTVKDDIAFGPENLCLPYEEIVCRVKSSLEAVGMYEYRNHTPDSLSGGQKQKIALASVLAMKPDILLLDEITSMLDPGSSDEVMGIIGKLHESGTTVVCVTHRMEELVYADRLLMMENGKIVRDGSPGSIMAEESNFSSFYSLPPVMELAVKLKKAGFIDRNSFPLSRRELREILCQLI